MVITRVQPRTCVLINLNINFIFCSDIGKINCNIYHNNNLFYKKINKSCFVKIKLDFDIDYLYMEINKEKIVIHLPKHDNLYNKHLINTDLDIQIIKSISSIQKTNIFQPNHNHVVFNKKSLIELYNNYLFFPKFKSLLPEWKSETEIFYKISDYFNFKSFRVSITKQKLLNYIFNSGKIGKLFIKNFAINTNKYSIVKPFTFRNVFTRRLYNERNPFYDTSYNIYSVASSRTHFYAISGLTNSKPIIKGSKFDHKKIIKNDSTFNPDTMIVFRLAPQDYHHFYMPTTGILLNYYYLGDDLQSVGYEFLYSNRFNPLNDNFRLVLEFRHINNSKKFYLIIIGATMVGSIIVEKLKIGSVYYTFQHLGYFDLGGSCVVFLSENNYKLRHDLIYYSKYQIETYLSVYDKITETEKNVFEQSLSLSNLNLHRKILNKKLNDINESKISYVFFMLIIIIFSIKLFSSNKSRY
jgi:phosphatidylserine decarboxylase